MSPTDVELSTTLMALKVIAYQAECHLEFLTSIASTEDTLDKAGLKYT